MQFWQNVLKNQKERKLCGIEMTFLKLGTIRSLKNLFISPINQSCSSAIYRYQINMVPQPIFT